MTVQQPRAAAAAARDRARVGLAGGYGFVMLGLTDSVLGVAWPSIRHTFGVPLTALSLLLIGSAAGYLLTAVPSGHLLNKFGPALVLASASLGAALACALIAGAPAFWVLPAAGLLLGAASGSVDAGLNTVVAGGGSARMMNFIHGAYGLGTVAGPILVTVAIVATGSWRVPFAILIGTEVLCSASWLAVRHNMAGHQQAGLQQATQQQATQRQATQQQATQQQATQQQATQQQATQQQSQQRDQEAGDPGSRRPPGGLSGQLHVVLTAMIVAVPFLYAGAEFSAGQWAASYLRDVPRLPGTAAGFAVAAYWGVFTAVRLALALPRRQPPPRLAIRAGCLVALAGAVLLWLAGGSGGGSIAGFVVIGAGVAPVFPALLILTPARLGPAKSRHIIGWQLAAAGAGGRGISALTGLMLGRLGLAALGPVLIALAILMLASSEVLDALAAGSRRR